MSEVLRCWLTDRLGIVLDFTPELIGHNIRDGRIIAHLLYSYNVITKVQLRVIIPTDDSSKAKANWRHISKWLKSLNVLFSDSLLTEIAQAKGSASIRLLYQLYLVLKTRRYIIKPFDKLNYTPPSNLRFTVSKVKKLTDDDRDKEEEIVENLLTKPLLEKQELVDWYKKKYKEIEDIIQAARRRTRHIQDDVIKCRDQIKKIRYEQKEKKQIEDNQEYKKFSEMVKQFEKVNPIDDKNYTFEELTDMMRNAQLLDKLQCDPNKAKEIIHRIKLKFRQNIATRKFKTKLETMLVSELWQNLLNKQEEEFDKTVAEKTLKMSEYEKQMITRCFDVRNKKKIAADNRIIVENLIAQKREAEFSRAVLEHKEEARANLTNFNLERQRVIELHKKLYYEKMRLRAEQEYIACKCLVNALIDLACKIGGYRKEFKQEVPKHLFRNWKTLVIANKPLFSYIHHVEKVINETPGPVEEITKQEYERQSVLNRNDFDEYWNYYGQWDINEIFQEEGEIPETLSNNGLLILGHIVHRLLLYKYPLPPNLLPPELPKFNIKSCVVNVKDFTMLPILCELLKEYNIALISIENAINYCLKAFKDELIGIEDVELKLLEETVYCIKPENIPPAHTIVKNPKDGKSVKSVRDLPASAAPEKGAKSKKDATPKDKSKKSTIEHVHTAILVDKPTQTPKMLPEERVTNQLSHEALLGKYAYESLSLGKPLTDYIIAAMFVEYLKTLKTSNGWVMFNYPKTSKQANVLENAVTARDPHIVDSEEDELITLPKSMHFLESNENLIANLDPDRNKRYSQLLPNPHPPLFTEEHTTFLTSFISTRYISMKENTEKKDCYSDYEKGSPLELFYTNQGVHYILYYKVFDFKTVIQLAKLIIGNYSLPLKTSEQLFGSVYNELKNQYMKDASGTHKVPASVKSQITTDLSINETIIEEITEYESEKYEPAPGDPEWVYTSFPIKNKIAIGIATVWENTELNYMCDSKELFAIKRTQRDTIIPYMNYVKDRMMEFKSRPDNKQNIVQKFQINYNNIDNDLRDDEEVRAELHCRVDELRNELWSICDIRMTEVENERQRIINENWIAEQLVYLTNLFVSLLQLEVNRCSDTVQVIQDYYLAMLGARLNPDDLFIKVELTKIETIKRSPVKTTESGFQLPIIHDESIPKEYTPDGISINKLIAKIFTNCESIVPIDKTTFVSVITNNVSIATKYVNDLLVKAIKVINEQAAAKGAKKSESKKTPNKIAPNESITPEEKMSLIQEWTTAINSELERTKVRLWCIQIKSVKDLNEIYHCAQSTFHNIYNEILNQYEREIASINTVCNIFCKAIEDQVKIQQELVLSDDKFLVYSDTLLYPTVPPLPPDPLKEYLNEGLFSTEQLNKLYTIFIDLAPTGSIPERVLTFLLQDLIYLDTDDGIHEDIPDVWRNIDPLKFHKILYDLFGDPEFVDWRDFLVYCMGLSFPTEQEILKMKMTFGIYDEKKEELISRKHYYYIQLWFERIVEQVNLDVSSNNSIIVNSEIKSESIKSDESNFEERQLLRIRLLKDLLFKMFETRPDYMNYTGFLLAFCKDEDPMIGLAKALTLTLNSLICWDAIEGEIQEEKDKQQFNATQEELYLIQNEEQSVLSDYNCVCGDFNITDVEDIVDQTPIDILSDENFRQQTVDDKYPYITRKFYERPMTEISNVGEETLGEGHKQVSFMSLTLAHMFSDEELRIYKNRIYLLPFQSVCATLTATLPWHIRSKCIENNSLRELLEKIYSELQEAHTYGHIYAYKFLQHPVITELLENCNKFKAFYLPVIVKKYLLAK